VLTISAEICLLTRARDSVLEDISLFQDRYCSFNFHCAFGVHSFYTQEYIETALWGTLLMVSQGTLKGVLLGVPLSLQKNLGGFGPCLGGTDMEFIVNSGV